MILNQILFIDTRLICLWVKIRNVVLPIRVPQISVLQAEVGIETLNN